MLTKQRISCLRISEADSAAEEESARWQPRGGGNEFDHHEKDSSLLTELKRYGLFQTDEYRHVKLVFLTPRWSVALVMLVGGRRGCGVVGERKAPGANLDNDCGADDSF